MRRWVNRRAMTFVELLAVLVILGLIAGVMTVSFAGRLSQGKRAIAKTQIAQIVQALESYHIANGAWPNAGDGLSVLTIPRASPASAYFLKPEQLIDPWDQPFELIVPGPLGYPYEVISYGADAVPAGEGDSADISSINLRERPDGP